MSEILSQVKEALSAYSRALDLKNDRAAFAQRLYIEHNCIEWLSKIVQEYKANDDSSLNHDTIQEYRDLLDKYSIDIDSMKAMLKAQEEGRLVILPHARDAKKKKPSCWHSQAQSRWCVGLCYHGENNPIDRCKNCYYLHENANERAAANKAQSSFKLFRIISD